MITGTGFAWVVLIAGAAFIAYFYGREYEADRPRREYQKWLKDLGDAARRGEITTEEYWETLKGRGRK